MNKVGLVVALGVIAINVLVIVLDKSQYIALVQTVDMVLVPLVGGIMPTSTTIQTGSGDTKPETAGGETNAAD